METATSYDPTTGVVEGEATLVRVPEHRPEVDMLAVLEKRGKLLERVLEYAIAATHPEQWYDFQGTPWPSGPACEAMARRCGVSVRNMSRRKRHSSDDLGEFYIYEVDATVDLPSGFDSIEAFGTCSSRDNFLGTETAAGRKMSEIDEGNIQKAAYTNMIVNGVTRLLGVRRLSWDRLATLGIDKDKTGKVAFNAGSKGGGQQASGSDLVIKFGRANGKTFREITDEDLTWYKGVFETELADQSKSRFHANTKKQLDAAVGEQARRANEKAGTAPKVEVGVTPWQRIVAICGQLGLSEEKTRDLTKSVTKKESPKDLNEADIAAVHDAAALLKKQAEEKW